MLGTELLELAVDLGDLRVEVIDHANGRQHAAAPRLGELQARKQLAARASE